MADVVFEHVAKTYPSGVLAVDDFSLSVADGELVVLVGPSGCGKTTLLRLVAGLEEPASGGISIGGRPVDGVPPRKRNVAMVFQQDSLYPHLNVRDNLAFGLRLRGVARAEIERRVASAAKELGIEDLLGRRPVELSGGQRQRVALGRALTGRPSVFLLDEPLASLDAPLRADVRRLVRRVHQQVAGATLYVTHDQTEAMSLADRLGVVRAGRLEQVGHPLALYRQPANRFVAQLIGSPAMNILRGQLTSRDGELFFEAGLCLPIPRQWHARLAARSSPEILLGLRPEHIRPATPGEGQVKIRAAVEAVEPLGPDTLVHAVAGPCRLTVRADGEVSCRPGESVELAVDMRQACLFDAETENAL